MSLLAVWYLIGAILGAAVDTRRDSTAWMRRAEDIIAWFKRRPQAELERVEVVVLDMSKTYASAIQDLFGPAVVNGQKLAVAITSLRPQRT
jgi:transposase